MRIDIRGRFWDLDLYTVLNSCHYPPWLLSEARFPVTTSPRATSITTRNIVFRGVAAMVEAWWTLLGAVPVLIASQAFRMKARHADEQRIKSARGREKTADDIFVCERVCTSNRMLKKVGAFSKDPIPDTCVTVCGVSELDACADACARTVCVNQHQVPNWNDVCLRRCQSECLKLSASHSS